MAELNDKDLNAFYDYLMAFYGPDSDLYPMKGLTRDLVIKATDIHLAMCNCGHPRYTWGQGDSIDREQVREILLAWQDDGFATIKT